MNEVNNMIQGGKHIISDTSWMRGKEKITTNKSKQVIINVCFLLVLSCFFVFVFLFWDSEQTCKERNYLHNFYSRIIIKLSMIQGGKQILSDTSWMRGKQKITRHSYKQTG